MDSSSDSKGLPEESSAISAIVGPTLAKIVGVRPSNTVANNPAKIAAHALTEACSLRLRGCACIGKYSEAELSLSSSAAATYTQGFQSGDSYNRGYTYVDVACSPKEASRFASVSLPAGPSLTHQVMKCETRNFNTVRM